MSTDSSSSDTSRHVLPDMDLHSIDPNVLNNQENDKSDHTDSTSRIVFNLIHSELNALLPALTHGVARKDSIKSVDSTVHTSEELATTLINELKERGVDFSGFVVNMELQAKVRDWMKRILSSSSANHGIGVKHMSPNHPF